MASKKKKIVIEIEYHDDETVDYAMEVNGEKIEDNIPGIETDYRKTFYRRILDFIKFYGQR